MPTQSELETLQGQVDALKFVIEVRGFADHDSLAEAQAALAEQVDQSEAWHAGAAAAITWAAQHIADLEANTSEH